MSFGGGQHTNGLLAIAEQFTKMARQTLEPFFHTKGLLQPTEKNLLGIYEGSYN
jgi:hypothetical protein